MTLAEDFTSRRETVADISTSRLLEILLGRPDIAQYRTEIERLLHTAAHEVRSADEEPTHNTPLLVESSESFPVNTVPIYIVKVFGSIDATDHVKGTYTPETVRNIDSHDPYWQEIGTEYARHENDSMPLPCYEVNWSRQLVIARIRQSEGLLATLSGNPRRVNRLNDQIVANKITMPNMVQAVRSGMPWFSALTTELPFPIFTHVPKLRDILDKHFASSRKPRIDVTATTEDVDAFVERYFKNQRSNFDFSRGINLWDNSNATNLALASLAQVISYWMKAIKNNSFYKQTVLIDNPWTDLPDQDQVYFSALYGQALFHLLFPFIATQPTANNEDTRIIARLPSFSTSPIRHAQMMMLSANEAKHSRRYTYDTDTIFHVHLAQPEPLTGLTRHVYSTLLEISHLPWSVAHKKWATEIQSINSGM